VLTGRCFPLCVVALTTVKVLCVRADDVSAMLKKQNDLCEQFSVIIHSFQEMSVERETENKFDLTVEVHGMQSITDKKLTDYRTSDPTCEVQVFNTVYTTKSLRHLLPDGTLPTWNETFAFEDMNSKNGSLIIRVLNKFDGKTEPVLLGSLRFSLSAILQSRQIKGKFTLSEASQIHYAEDHQKEFISPFKENSLKEIKRSANYRKNDLNNVASNETAGNSHWPRIQKRKEDVDDAGANKLKSNTRNAYDEDSALQASLSSCNVISLCITALGQFYQGEREFVELIRRLGYLSHLEDLKNAGIRRIDDLLRGFDDTELIALFPEMKKSKRRLFLARLQILRGNKFLDHATKELAQMIRVHHGIPKAKDGPFLESKQNAWLRRKAMNQ